MKKIVIASLVVSLAGMLACAKSAPPSPSTENKESTGAGVPTPPSAPREITFPPGNSSEITIGKPPPDFIAGDQNGKEIQLSSFKGRPVVLYFYPKDETPGCTKEACAFRDGFTDFKKKGILLVGISADSDESHRAFIKNHQLPFSLISDPDGKIAAKFGVPFSLGFSARQTFVIDKDGNVKKFYRSVDVAAHAKEILNDLE